MKGVAMKTSTGVVNALVAGKQVRILLPESDTLKDGRRLFRQVQRDCGVKLVYIPKIGGEKPYMLIWRAGTHKEKNRLFQAERHDA